MTVTRLPRTCSAVLALAAGAALLTATAAPAGAAPQGPEALATDAASAANTASPTNDAASLANDAASLAKDAVSAAKPSVAGKLDAAQAALDALPATPNTAWGRDPATGTLVITVSDAAEKSGVDRLLAVAGRYGAPIRVRHAAGPLTEQLLGGDSMDNGDVICSDGFNVVKGGQAYVLTAGHCTASLRTWQGVGPSVASAFPGTDYGLVRNDSALPAPGAIDLYNGSSQPITAVGTATVGEHVCASGMATGYTCGTVTAVDQTVDYGDGQVVHGLIETNVHTDHGDSGGPLFDGATGLGTVSGGDGTTDYFQPLAPELAAYDVTLAP